MNERFIFFKFGCHLKFKLITHPVSKKYAILYYFTNLEFQMRSLK